MKLKQEVIEYIAELSRIKLNDSQKLKIGAEMSAILESAEVFDGADLTGVEPLSHVSPVRNVWREDIVKASFDRAALLANAAEHSDETVIVPKTVE